MSYKVIYHEDVDFEVRTAKRYYRKINPELVKVFSKEVKSLVEEISKNPLHFQVNFEEIRSAYLTQFPFGIRFICSEGVIKIFSIIHTSRNPKIWQERK